MKASYLSHNARACNSRTELNWKMRNLLDECAQHGLRSVLERNLPKRLISTERTHDSLDLAPVDQRRIGNHILTMRNRIAASQADHADKSH
ncbi:hypothetical protein DB347_24470 [Opitutaceae bacterium EW11]|nr:hypothetical protein DB347_24470 [Opitutaceae bacterium EW11]